MIWDYWLNELHDDCDGRCSSPIHEMLEAYMATPSSNEPLCALENVLARMFELRMDIEFSLSAIFEVRAIAHGIEPSMAAGIMHHLPPVFRQFIKFHKVLLGSLGGHEQISHLMPISGRVNELVKEMPKELRNSIMHPGSGFYGAVNVLDKSPSERPPETSFLVCANLISAFVDGLMHAMPGSFAMALGKTQSCLVHMGHYDPGLLRRQVGAYRQQENASFPAFDGTNKTSTFLASELTRLLWTFYVPFRAYLLADDTPLIAPCMPAMWARLRHQKILYYSKIAIVELYIFIDVCDRLRTNSLKPFAEDSVTGEILAHRDEISRLRYMVAHQNINWGYAAFSAELEQGIGSERLLYLITMASERARKIVVHYRATYGDSALSGSLPSIGRIYSLEHVEHETEICLERAHRALKARDLGSK